MNEITVYVILIAGLLGLTATKINNPNTFPKWLNKTQKQKIKDSQEKILAQIQHEYLEKRYFDNVAHDGSPETKEYNVKLDGTGSFDLDKNDGIRYSWSQIGNPIVKLSDPNSPVTYFEAPEGEYKFKLTVTDAYGSSADTTKTVTIGAEPNNTPTPIILVTNEKKPKPKPKPKKKKTKKQRQAEETLRKLKKKIGG